MQPSTSSAQTETHNNGDRPTPSPAATYINRTSNAANTTRHHAQADKSSTAKHSLRHTRVAQWPYFVLFVVVLSLLLVFVHKSNAMSVYQQQQQYKKSLGKKTTRKGHRSGSSKGGGQATLPASSPSSYLSKTTDQKLGTVSKAPPFVPPPINRHLLAHYNAIVHERCECKQPLLDTYEAVYAAEFERAKEIAQRGNVSLSPWLVPSPLWAPDSYGLQDPIRRFLKAWFLEVMSYRRRNKQRRNGEDYQHHESNATSSSSSPVEARLLIIGDSLSRNMFYSMILQTIDEGVGGIQNGDDPNDEVVGGGEEKEDLFAEFVKNAVFKGGDTYQTLFVTWSPRVKSNRSAQEDDGDEGNTTYSKSKQQQPLRATIKIRYEQETYFSMDSHSIKSSRGLEFNPTHVFIGRGMWDIVHCRPRDPSIALSGLSAGLVRLRKELSEHREGLVPEERKLYPPTRVVYWGLPKMFKSTDPFANNKNAPCAFDVEQNYFRDALYAAVRRANGALLHMHGEKNFNSVAIEFFDYYPLMMAAGANKTQNGDCIHPEFTARLAILAQLLDLVSQPPSSLKQVVDRVEDAKRGREKKTTTDDNMTWEKPLPLLNATMYIPPPLVVRSHNGDNPEENKEPNIADGTSTLRSTADTTISLLCPLSFTADEVHKILSPPKLANQGGVSTGDIDDVDDFTVPKLSPMFVTETTNGTITDVGTHSNRNTTTSTTSSGNVSTTTEFTLRSLLVCPTQETMNFAMVRLAATNRRALDEALLHEKNQTEVAQRKVNYLFCCSNMMFSFLMGHRTLMPFYTMAKNISGKEEHVSSSPSAQPRSLPSPPPHLATKQPPPTPSPPKAGSKRRPSPRAINKAPLPPPSTPPPSPKSLLPPPVTDEEVYWTGNRCLQFINSEIEKDTATTSSFRNTNMTYLHTLWDYTTDRHKMRCAMVPLIAWTFGQPTRMALSSGDDVWDREQLVRCATEHSGARMQVPKP